MNTGLIVLHTTKFGENSLVVHTLSREYGRRSFLVRGVGKKASMSLFLPLNILEADIQESNKSDLFTARNIVSRHPLLGIRNNIFKNSMTMFLSEVLYRVVKDGAAEQGLFEWCEKNILLLDSIQTDFSNFHIRFLLELTVALGFSPEAKDLAPFVGEHYPVTERFMTLSFAESMLIPLNGTVRNEIAEEILRYIEFHSESAVNVNSLKVLRELFA
ncbi:MAG: DNA repair protein RecO [Bacteroidales bacterium]|jgi:DNA repair protein RecO (recombination protein O)|nr:DNA repair protein RecO [Bacteroidales bacterium]